MSVTKITAYFGEPGTGKSYQLTNLAKSLIKKGESVHVVCPTRPARDNIKRGYDDLLKQGRITRQENITLKSSTQVLHGYDKSKATNLIIEEAGMIEVTVLHGLLHIAQLIDNVHLYIFGDIKQLPTIQGTSIIEKIVRVNKMNGDVPFWQWVNRDAYDSIESQTLETPFDWQTPDVKIDMKVLRKNYRLNKAGFSSYDNKYYDYVIDNAITKEDYSSELKYAIEHDYLIICPTKSRGKQVNELLNEVYKNGLVVDSVAPFILVNGNLYLNPYNKRYDTLKEKFYFINQIRRDSIKGYEPTAFITTHASQGATVDNVLYFMGNKKIWKTNRNHYNNNQLYTAVTRARHDVKLLGLKESFQEMRTIYPLDVKDNLKSIRKKAAMDILISNLKEEGRHPKADDIYSMFNDYMNDDSIVDDYELRMINYYNTPQDSYSKRYVVSQVNRRVNVKHGFSDLEMWLNDNRKESKKVSRSGKVQQWIDSLSENKLQEVVNDVGKLSQSEFRDKYKMTRNITRKWLLKN